MVVRGDVGRGNTIPVRAFLAEGSNDPGQNNQSLTSVCQYASICSVNAFGSGT
jgi:hypothetical protein